MQITENQKKMKIVDNNLEWFGYTILQSMENAGREIGRAVERKYGTGKRIGIFCGLGNNGGDGFVSARYLSERNDVVVFLVGKPKDIGTKEARINWDVLHEMDLEKHLLTKNFSVLKNHKFDIVIDSILGLGLKGELREPVKSLVKKLNGLKAKRVAVDIPTGFGTKVVVKDDFTLSLHFRKKKGAKVLDIGIPNEFDFYIGPGHVKALTVPKENSRKGGNGNLMIVGGSKEYHGAPIMSAIAASRFVDMVYYHSPEKLNEKILVEMKSQSLNFVMPNVQWMDKIYNKSDVILIGNGLGDSPNTKKVVNDLLKKYGGRIGGSDVTSRRSIKSVSASTKKIVLDADALRVVDKKYLKGCIVTPHANEFKVLFGKRGTEKSILEMARTYRCIVVLKGKVDLVSDGKNVWKNFTGNAEMTRGGTGDVLAGIIAALACNNDLLLSAQAGIFLNGYAGDLLKERRGKFNATDLANELWNAYRSGA